MSTIADEQILEYVAANIDSFHESRLARLNSLELDELLERKNPYLFKSKNIVTVSDLIGAMLDAYLSSQEEELFGVFLEGLAVFIASEAIGGRKSGITGIDLEFERGADRYIVSIKSGPNWGNSSQINKMKDHFTEAGRVLRQGNRTLKVIAINGCCYGRESSPDKGDYFKICGQEFWEMISNDRDLYIRIIEPLAHNAKQRNDAFLENYGPVVNQFCAEFTRDYCVKGVINWAKLVALSSAITPLIHRPPKTKYYINRLPNLMGVCDSLRNWDAPELAERIEYLTSDQAEESKVENADLGSLRGFLMFWSAVESDGNIALSFSQEELLTAQWTFPDQRSVELRFLDIDHVELTAVDISGSPVRIGNSKTVVRRRTVLKTAMDKLIERGLFTQFEGN